MTCLFAGSMLFSQEIKTLKSYAFTDSSGNFYIKRSEPMHLWLGFTKDSTQAMHLLRNGSIESTEPFFFDEGLNIISSQWAVDTQTHIKVYPPIEIEFEVHADGIPPETHLYYGNANLKRIGKTNFINDGLNIKLKATDTASGVYLIYYSIDKAEYQVYENPIDCSAEKDYLIQYYAIDNVGNVEKANKYRFTVDKTKPHTELTVLGDQYENVLSHRSKIALNATDTISGVSYIKVKIDKGKYYTYKGQLHTSNLKQGEHILYYYAVDHIGNKEDEKTFRFFVDKTPPILIEEVLGNSFMNNGKEFSSGRSKLKLTAVDNKAGIQSIFYSMNNGEYVKYEKPFYLSMTSGSLNIKSYAVDNVNNKSEASSNTAKRNVTHIDLTGPEISFSFDGPKFEVLDSIYINKNTIINLKAKDDGAGFKSMDYNINGGERIVYEKGFSIEKQGLYKINSTAFDNVNNSNYSEFSVVVDNTGPQIFSRFSIFPLESKEINGNMVNVYSSQVALFLSVTDARVAIDKIYYQINDEPEQRYISYIGGFKQGMDYNVKVRATDKLGNETIDSIIFATDATGPEIYVQFSAPAKAKKEVDGKTINVYPAYVALFLSVSNAHIAYEKIYYSINGSPEKVYTGVIEKFKEGSEITMKIRAVDILGSQTSKEIQFAIE